jgi:hypothetical protein
LQWLVVSFPTLEYRLHLCCTLQHVQHCLLVKIINMKKMRRTSSSFTCQLKLPVCETPYFPICAIQPSSFCLQT